MNKRVLIKLIIYILIILYLAIFILKNNNPIVINFVFFKTKTYLPLVILFSILIGILAGLITSLKTAKKDKKRDSEKKEKIS